MDMKALRDYGKWLLHSPQDVIDSVKSVRWHNVFPSRVPRWANKVRNYFNINPTWLRLLDKTTSAEWLSKAQKFIRVGGPPVVKAPKPSLHPSQPAIEKIAEMFAVTKALSGDVYIGDFNRKWYQMSPGATIYHYGEQPKVPAGEAAWATAKTQNFVPVFKLVSPDGTDGSLECCITNPVVDWILFNGVAVPMRGSRIGDVHEVVNVRDRIVDNPLLQGSYNYSETIEMGLAAHELRDVKPHTGEQMLYSNPISLFSTLRERRFRVIDNWGHTLADQE
jgi:hypothetical protein